MALKWTDGGIATAVSITTDDILLIVDDPGGTPVSQKITWGNVLGSFTTPFSLTLLDDADAATARTTLGVDAAGTDNSTNVTLAGAYDYLTLSGQQITLGQIDYATDISNTPAIPTDPAIEISAGAPVFATGITAAEMRTLIGVDPAGTDNSTDVTLAGAYDYLTIVGQTITLGQIDYNTDIANIPAAGDAPAIIDSSGTPTLAAGITAAEVRTLLDVDPSGTDNSTNVTLATVTGNYLSIVGQEITAGTVPVSLGGTGATTASAARTALGVAIGSDVQAWSANLDSLASDPLTATTAASAYQPLDSDLTSIAALNPTANNLIYVDGGGAWAAASLTTFARSILDDANAAAVRTTIGVDAAGTDNSTDVTIAAGLDYVTIAGQELTLGAVDLTTDVTGTLPITSGGTGATTAAGARTALGVDPAGTDNSTDVTLNTLSYDYLSISGQEITLGAVDALTDLTNFDEATDDRVSNLLVAGTDISLTYNDVANTLTVAYTGTSGATALDGLTDVNAPTPSTGDIIRFDGAEWSKYPDSNFAAATHSHAASDVVSGTLDDARISESSVTQHQAALSITESQISDLGNYVDAGTALVYSIIF